MASLNLSSVFGHGALPYLTTRESMPLSEAAGMSDEQRRDYERAAVALETFKPHTGGPLVIKAYEAVCTSREITNHGRDNYRWTQDTKRAARLLRDCIEKNTELP
jgi:hypothetical protein